MFRLNSRISGPAVVLLAWACGGDGGAGGGPDDPVLTAITVTPNSASLYNTAPGNAVTLTVVAQDQKGRTLAGITPAFTTGSSSVATVSATGTVAAVASGTTQISVSMTHGGVTLTAQVPVVVQVPALQATVTSTPVPVPSFVPKVTHLSAGGSVLWSLTGPEHSVTFTSLGSPANVASLINASASRSFPNAGTFNYVCDFHPTMSGTVYVH